MKKLLGFIEQYPRWTKKPKIIENLPSIYAHMGKLSGQEAEKIADYMSNAAPYEQWLSSVFDPINHNHLVPNINYSDGYYAWNEMLIHFVRQYKVDLPPAFITHVRNCGYNIKAQGQLNLDQIKRDINSLSVRIAAGDTSFYETF